MALSHRFSEALAYTAVLHAEQKRKSSGEPYLAHLLAVAAIVMEHGGTEDEAIAALLHDAAEDQGGEATLAEIGRRFGPSIATIVEGCSDTMESPKPAWRQRKEAHLAQLRNASPSVLLVTAADKLHNARSILREYRRHGETLWSHFRGGRNGTLWYNREVLGILEQAGRTPLVEEFARTVAEIERLARQ